VRTPYSTYILVEAGTHRYNVGTDTPKLSATSLGGVPEESNFLAALTLPSVIRRFQGTRQIHVILYAKGTLLCGDGASGRASGRGILAVEHDVIPLDGADAFQQGEIDSVGRPGRTG
jgi:hypothetical protein